MAYNAVGSLVGGWTLVLICAYAFMIRLFSVVKYESVIHEFDPYFNYRVTQFLTKEGFYNLWNWFDDRTWYPLGRIIGGTMFPGLTFTAGAMYKLLHFFNIPLDVQEVCVFTAPLFSALCALAMYGFVREIRGNGPGLLAAAFVSCVPSYISRSVAGSFDNEGVAIFALVFVFFLFVKTLNTGSLSWATATSLAYLYMVMSWGAYTFIINLIPIHCLASLVTGRMNPRIYVAYAPLIVMGTLLSASIPVVGFNAVLMSEHFGAFLTFGILHAALLISWIKSTLPEREFRQAKTILITAGAILLAVVSLLVVASVMASPTYGWTGRSLSLLDPTYASKYIPIIASVSEHQPPTWASYFMDIHILVLLLPAGFISCFLPLTDASLFLLLYGLTSVYFSGVMVRLMLVLAPAACGLAAVALSRCLEYIAACARAPQEDPSEEEAREPTHKKTSRPSKKAAKKERPGRGPSSERLYVPRFETVIVLIAIAILLSFYTLHSTWVSSEMYSAPSIVLQSRQKDGSYYVFDDFREAYSWMRHNTAEDSKIASWWDYGYQTTAMANRTVMVDNNTWNNTHIATIGRAMASPERKAWKIYRSLDVNYVFVVFGGYIGYPSDDINKFLWMVRIGGGVFPEIRESDYLNSRGGYSVDESMGQGLKDCLLYKLSYYRFGEAAQMVTGQFGYDRVRNTQIGKSDIRLKYFEEAFTSEHWMVRVYRVKEPFARGSKRKNPKRKKISSQRRVQGWSATGIVGLRDEKLKEFPAALREIAPRLSAIDASVNQIRSLPSYIDAFQQLQRLILARNELVTLPESLSQLQSLKVVVLDHNRISTFPLELCRLPRLEKLSIASNCLTEIPEAMGQLTLLRELDLSNNRIAEMHCSFRECLQLESLNITDNKIRVLPVSLQFCIRLRELHCDRNLISEIPSEILIECRALQTLTLDGNRIDRNALEETDGYKAFEQRRQEKASKAISSQVMLGQETLNEAISRRT